MPQFTSIPPDMPVIAQPSIMLSSAQKPGLPGRPVLRLQNGDRLKQPEFHRRYAAMPENVRAELVEGIVYMASALRVKVHARPHQMINGWLGNYWAATPGADCGDKGSLFLDLDNEVQPDVYLRIEERAGGASRTTEDDYLAGAPELIFEIAASSASYDMHQKKEAYRRNGVREYAVWRTEDRAVDWWELVDGEFVPLPADDTHCIHSQVFPGLALDVTALLEDRLADVLARVQQGIQSEQHAAFCAQLRARLLSA